MFFRENLILKLHNWRSFKTQTFTLPTESFVLTDDNGTGKTSLISAFYSLLTGQSWPGTKLAQHLRVGESYFGVSTQLADWSFTGQISASGRLVSKYQKLDLGEFGNLLIIPDRPLPKVLTYLPTDNYWFSQSRSSKLDILDNLLVQVLGQKYVLSLQKLDKMVKSKQRLIKHILDNDGQNDEVLLDTLNQSILEASLSLWTMRQEFFEYLQQNLGMFESRILSPLKNWQLKWEISNFVGQKEYLNLSLGENFNKVLESLKPDFQRLWQKELLIGKVMFGAQRDDFKIVSGHAAVEDVLSRGEMRLLVLFIKNLGRKYIKEHFSDQPVFWLLDDVFNEFDSTREGVVVNEILNDTDYFVVTATETPIPDIKRMSLKDLTTAVN
jgi:recombinational DNA repair ATPase RecF